MAHASKVIPAYRRHTTRCTACAAPDVEAGCARCRLPFCDVHAPDRQARCGACEAQWAFGQAVERGWRHEVLEPLIFAAVVSGLVVMAVVGSWPGLWLLGAVAMLTLGAQAPRLHADAERRAFLRERFERERRS